MIDAGGEGAGCLAVLLAGEKKRPGGDEALGWAGRTDSP